MSSREIAELTGKEHRNVLRDVRRMLEDLGVAPLSFERSYIGGDGTSRPCFELPKRECLILVSGYDVNLRARIIDRWQELEEEFPSGEPEAGARVPLRYPLYIPHPKSAA